jgi:hypothetical protein
MAVLLFTLVAKIFPMTDISSGFCSYDLAPAI